MSFDPSWHLTGGDITFHKAFVKIASKWSKTIQDLDKLYVLSIPKIRGSALCPYSALKTVVKVFKPSKDYPLFQIITPHATKVLIDSRNIKVLFRLNVKMGLAKNFYTFHIFRRSGATLAFNAHIPIHRIRQHGSWTSDCVWLYINQDQAQGEAIASSLAQVLQNV